MKNGSDIAAKWYATVNDDVRSELIDKGWFGQDGSRPMEQSVSGAIAAHDKEVADSAWGRLPDAETRSDEPTIGELYGSRQNEPEAAELYGQQPPDIEQGQ